ncbi:DUF3500 domain-containing protein [Actinokineospora auranticolor]|uniref:Uncharacterized protein DUF3500 n=1 Tax=Actinokineospora auranticolor TaxID=155976 RepID=A0A2S6GQG0_9PSEU|nr:DUF3500 domain-containing protein [Actinokineospora auranticolor]PPK67439.1 uncharacterized protein DUF3500 [Actinokineospora auranticolor]
MARWSKAVPLTALLLTTACAASGSDSPSTEDGAAQVAACPVAAPAAPTSPVEAAAAVLTATRAFLAMLDDQQEAAVLADRTRANLAHWSGLPDESFTRAGLRLDELDDARQSAVFAILKSALSPEGYEQVKEITTADGILAAEAKTSLDFGADHYWIRVLGTPSSTEKWTVQFGGHHLAVNLTLSGTDMTLAPTLWGAQPASYASEGAAIEPLCGEVAKAAAVVDSLTEEQRVAATLPEPVREIVLGAGQDGKALPAGGIRASTLSAAQKKLLLSLVREWITPLNSAAAAAKLAEAERAIDAATFAWAGDTAAGQPVYYRVQGPTYTIELAHRQDQDGIARVDSIYREPENDYGAQLGP